jgi:Gpi18-like mannosyltransferase
VTPEANNYPPVYPILLRLLRWVHRGLNLPGDFTWPLVLADDLAPQRPVILLLKQPAIVADAIATVVIYCFARRFKPGWTGVLAAALYAFSPALIYDGAYYGQTDTILVAVLIGALAAWSAGRLYWLGGLMTTALLLKAQALPVVVVLIAAITNEARRTQLAVWGRVVAGGLFATALIALLAAWTGQLRQFHDGYLGLVGKFPRVTINALNAWWLLSRPWHKGPVIFDFPLDTDRIASLISYRMLGMVALAIALIVILWRLHRAGYMMRAVVLAAIAAAWAFFHLPTEMHERYSIPAVGLMYLAGIWQARWFIYASLASIATLVNILIVCPFVFPPSRTIANLVNWVIWPERHIEWTIMAVVQVLMFLLALEALWRVGSQERRPSGAFPIGGENSGLDRNA